MHTEPETFQAEEIPVDPRPEVEPAAEKPKRTRKPAAKKPVTAEEKIVDTAGAAVALTKIPAKQRKFQKGS